MIIITMMMMIIFYYTSNHHGQVQTMLHDCAITRGAGGGSAGGGAGGGGGRGGGGMGGGEAAAHGVPVSSHAGYTLLLDFPMSIRPARMLRDKFPVE